MRKTLSALLGVGILFTAAGIAFAENFTYKVYNPKANKSYNAMLGTVRVTENSYLYTFVTQNGTPLCIASINTNKNAQGLVGSQCMEYVAFSRFMNGENIDMSKYKWGWRELSADTFYREMNAIKRERAAQGLYEYHGAE